LNISDNLLVQQSVQQTSSSTESSQSDTEEVKKVVEKSEFSIKLDGFDASVKAKVIKELKTIFPGINLVEAKKMAESAPKVIKENVLKEEAEKIKKMLESVGAKVVLE
jgi:large subunit ribosomal protein L7/L12